MQRRFRKPRKIDMEMSVTEMMVTSDPHAAQNLPPEPKLPTFELIDDDDRQEIVQNVLFSAEATVLQAHLNMVANRRARPEAVRLFREQLGVTIRNLEDLRYEFKKRKAFPSWLDEEN